MAKTDMEQDIEKSIFEMKLAELKAMPDSPEKQEMIGRLFQDYEGKEAIIAEELALAEGEANTEQPQGTQAGGIFVAPSALQNIAAAGTKGLGMYKQKRAMDDKRALSDDRTAGMVNFMSNATGANAGMDPADIDSMQGEMPLGQGKPMSTGMEGGPVMSPAAQQAAPAALRTPAPQGKPLGLPAPAPQAAPMASAVPQNMQPPMRGTHVNTQTPPNLTRPSMGNMPLSQAEQEELRRKEELAMWGRG